jgi:HlyD family secretion protein
MRKRIVWMFVVLVAVASVGAFLYYKSKHAPPPFTLETEPLAKRRIVGRVTATGTLLATVTVQVGTQVSGRIQKLNADYNSEVKKGQLVAKIDPLLFQAALEQSRANYLQAKAQVESAKASSELNKKLYARELALQKDNLAAQQDVETAETNSQVADANVEVARANLAQNQASLHQAEANLDYTNIISPIDGTVISRNVDVGQTVAASLSAPVIFTIAEDLHKMQVNTNVSEGDVGRLETGMEATFTVDAFPGRSFKGTISQIRNSATTLQNVVTYDAVIDVNNDDLKLRPGMTANTTVIYAEKDDVLSVPNAALRFRPPPEMTAPDASGSAGEHHHHHGDGQGQPSGESPSAASSATDGSAERHHRDADGGSPHGGEGRGEGRGDAKTVWIERGGLAVATRVHLGLTDGSYTEVMGRDIKEGDPVIVDALQAGKSSTPGAPAGGGPKRSFF